jgi:hypothetical protein
VFQLKSVLRSKGRKFFFEAQLELATSYVIVGKAITLLAVHTSSYVSQRYLTRKVGQFLSQVLRNTTKLKKSNGAWLAKQKKRGDII